MKIFTNGYKANSQDIKALDHYLNVTPKEWLHGALKGMINKAVKSIQRDYFEKYQDSTETISTDPAVYIPAIIALPDFKPYKQKFEEEKPKRKNTADTEICEGGFDIEDYEEIALSVYYEDYEETLKNFMENKIARRKKAMIKEHIQEEVAKKSKATLPSQDDDIIDVIVAKTGYKNRVQKEAEEISAK